MADQPQQTTVAEDAVAAAGVPQAGLMQMARALAPKTDMDQNTGVTEMSGGGVVRMQDGGLSGVSRDLGVYSPTMGTTSPMHSETGILYSEMTDAELGPMAALGDANAAMELRARGIGDMNDGEVTEVELDGLTRRRLAPHPVLGVAPVAREPWRHHFGAVQQQRHPGIADPVRRQELEFVGDAEGELITADDGVHVPDAAQIVRAQRRGGLGDEGVTERRHGVAPQPQTAGGAMTAEGEQVF